MCEEHATVIFTASGLIYMCGKDCIQEDENYYIPTVHQYFNEKAVKSVCVSVWAGSFSAALITMSGEVHTWGRGSNGNAYGHGEHASFQQTPKLVEALNGKVCTQVDLGEYHAAVLTEDGKVYTVGVGTYGQLGHGKEEEILHVPTLVKALETIDIKQVQCGYSFTMALSTSGYVYFWGKKVCQKHHWDYWKTGFPSRYGWYDVKNIQKVMLPHLVKGLRDHNVVQISCQYDHCAALVDPSASAIRQAQQLHFNNQQYSDVTFRIGENSEPIYASIDVLSSKSEYFEAMFRSNMRESIERVVEVPGDTTTRGAFLKMLEYLCLDDFVVEDEVQVPICELMELAEMYMLEGLQLLLMRSEDVEGEKGGK